ncbi:MAG: hypothetical protein JWR59_1196 [Brevundimonas sp.]|nr:hypothetical protein [Brevundimonas sp.]
MTQDPFVSLGFQPRRSNGGLLAPLMWVAGLVATVAALTVGAILAIFTAAAVAVFALCASVLVFFAGFALRSRRKISPRARSEDGVIEAQKVGDTWVTYGWERPGR